MSTASPPTSSAPAAKRQGAGSWLPWALMALVLVGALAWGAVRDPGPQTDQDQVTAIARTIKCPGCAGETVAESNAASSREIRIDIARRVAAGESADDIRAHYAAAYGSEILLTPGGSGASALVWAIPVVAVGVTLFGLVVLFVRRRSGPDDADQPEPAPASDAVHEGVDLVAEPDAGDAGAQGAQSPEPPAGPSPTWGPRVRIASVGLVVLLVAGGVGWWVARSSGSRGPSDTISGDIRSSTIAEIADANQLTALANQLLGEGRGDEAIAAYQQAIAAYDKVLELEPAHTEAMTYRGWLLHNIALGASPAAAAELDARALEWISQAIAIDAGYADARIFRAILLRDSHPVEALSDLETVAPAAVPPAMREMVDALRRQISEAAAATTATAGPAPDPGG